MADRTYSRVPGRNLIVIGGQSEPAFDPDRAVPVLAQTPAALDWEVLSTSLVGAAFPDSDSAPSAGPRPEVAMEAETAAWVESRAHQEFGPLPLELADECFGRAPGEAIRFLTEACLLCLTGLDETHGPDTSEPADRWRQLRNALLEVSFPYRSLPVFRVLRDELERRMSEQGGTGELAALPPSGTGACPNRVPRRPDSCPPGQNKNRLPIGR